MRPQTGHTRRRFLASALSGLAGLAPRGYGQQWLGLMPRKEAETPGKRIVKCQIGNAVSLPWGRGTGDVWFTAWADDGDVYAISDETHGFGNVTNSNIAIHRITGIPPDLQGTTVNPLVELGQAAESKADGAKWNSCGLASIDGVLYLSMCRSQCNPLHERYAELQLAFDSSIIKSSDHGKTWSAMPMVGHAMFPGRTFSTPSFVDAGPNGHGSKGYPARWFVYAISNDGSWNNANYMTLGRVSRGLIGRLDPEDWEFIERFDDEDEPVWGPRYDAAQCVLWAPGRTSQAGMTYFAALDLYVLPQWHYRYPEDPQRRWGAVRWEFYQARQPWGPWTLFHTQDFDVEGWYDPCIPSKYISEDGLHFWILTSGHCCENESVPEGRDARRALEKLYRPPHLMSVTLEIETRPASNAGNRTTPGPL